MHGNHVATLPVLAPAMSLLALDAFAGFEVQKCIEQMPPESVSFVVEAVEDKTGDLQLQQGRHSAAVQGQGRSHGGSHLRL